MQLDHARARVARRAGLVETDVTVAADAEEHEIEAAGGADRGLVARGLGVRVRWRDVGHVRAIRRQIDVREETLAHPRTKRVRMIALEVEVLVEVERRCMRERDTPLVAHANQLAVHAGRRVARRKSEHEPGLRAQERRDLVGDGALGFLARIEDDGARPARRARHVARRVRPSPSLVSLGGVLKFNQ
jgi:hypothetical protein